MAHPCPTVQQLVDGVKSLTRQQEGTFQTAWSDSFIDAYHCCEQGGFIYIDFPVPATVTRAWITRAPKGDTMNQRTTGPNAAIDLRSPGINMNNVILAANFHTHPLSPRVQGDPQPSPADYVNAYGRGVPGIVVSRDGIYAYGPDNRENLANPKGYPGPVEAPAIPRARLMQVRPPPAPPGAPPPWTVPKQWPEGTGVAVARAVSGGGEENNDADGGDAILVEWSNEGVEYGDTLVDSED